MLKWNVDLNGSSIQSRVASSRYPSEAGSTTTLALIQMSPSAAPTSCAMPVVNPLQPPPVRDTRKHSSPERVWSIFFCANGVMFMGHADAPGYLS
jgi:hypothetical protein